MADRPWYAHYDPGVPRSIDYPQVPLNHFLEEAARRLPDQPCTVFEEKTVSYAEMDSLSDRLAAALLAMGLKKGDRVGLLLPNIPQFVLCYYAILKAGGVVVAINPQYKQRELEFQVGDAGVRLMIGLDSAYPLLQTVRQHTTLRTILLTSLADAFALPEWAAGGISAQPGEPRLSPDDRWLSEAIGGQPLGEAPEAAVSADDVAIFQYSGGTTARRREPSGCTAIW